MNKRCLRIPGAWRGSCLLQGSRGLAVGRWEARRPPSQHKKVASAQRSTGSLGHVLWRVMEKLRFRGLIIAVYKSRDVCNTFRRWALASERFSLALLSWIPQNERFGSWERCPVSFIIWSWYLEVLGDLWSSSFSSLRRLNRLLTLTEQPTKAVVRARICLLPLNLSWIYYLQLVLPQPLLLYSVKMPWNPSGWKIVRNNTV